MPSLGLFWSASSIGDMKEEIPRLRSSQGVIMLKASSVHSDLLFVQQCQAASCLKLSKGNSICLASKAEAIL